MQPASPFEPRDIFFGTKNMEIKGKIKTELEDCPFGKTFIMQPRFGRPSLTYKLSTGTNKPKLYYLDLINLANFR